MEEKRVVIPMPKKTIKDYFGPKHLPHFRTHHPDVFKVKRQQEKYGLEDKK
jgi:hypothetical protein